jgi:hypothetical protein
VVMVAPGLVPAFVRMTDGRVGFIAR